MWPLAIEFGILDARHARAVGLHLLALDEDDRYARFGHALADQAVLAWVRHNRWQEQRWTGAWAGPDAMLVGALQLAPTGRARTWELALTVAAPLRRQGLGTALLGAALRDPALEDCRGLVCQHGHAALAGMARRLGLRLTLRRGEPRVALLPPGG
jgi:GNAT superfamily N-acetyltransferase